MARSRTETEEGLSRRLQAILSGQSVETSATAMGIAIARLVSQGSGSQEDLLRVLGLHGAVAREEFGGG